MSSLQATLPPTETAFRSVFPIQHGNFGEMGDPFQVVRNENRFLVGCLVQARNVFEIDCVDQSVLRSRPPISDIENDSPRGPTGASTPRRRGPRPSPTKTA